MFFAMAFSGARASRFGRTPALFSVSCKRTPSPDFFLLQKSTVVTRFKPTGMSPRGESCAYNRFTAPTVLLSSPRHGQPGRERNREPFDRHGKDPLMATLPFPCSATPLSVTAVQNAMSALG